MLLPVSWETHSAPEVGQHPQLIINRQLLAGCDLLVAVFWTRIGSPTGRAVSGTAEEIAGHRKAGGQVMLYFSDAPLPPSRTGGSKEAVKQYDGVRAFKASFTDAALYHTYTDTAQFAKMFRRHLEVIVNSYFKGAEAEPAATAELKLPRLAVEILEAAVETDHPINAVWGDTSGAVLAVGKTFGSEGSREKEALLQDSLTKLIAAGCIQEVSGGIYKLKPRAYELVRDYQARPEQRFKRIKQKMPELIAEMKADLSGEHGKVVREFALINSKSIFNSGDKARFVYFTDKHPHLRNLTDMLESEGYVVNVTTRNTPIYRMAEEFVELVLAYG